MHRSATLGLCIVLSVAALSFGAYQLIRSMTAIYHASLLARYGAPAQATVVRVTSQAKYRSGRGLYVTYQYSVSGRSFTGEGVIPASWSSPFRQSFPIIYARTSPDVSAPSVSYLLNGSAISIIFAVAFIGIPVAFGIRYLRAKAEES
jgi:hypothetical protein